MQGQCAHSYFCYYGPDSQYNMPGHCTGDELTEGCDGTAKAAVKYCSLPGTQSRPVTGQGVSVNTLVLAISSSLVMSEHPSSSPFDHVSSSLWLSPCIRTQQAGAKTIPELTQKQVTWPAKHSLSGNSCQAPVPDLLTVDSFPCLLQMRHFSSFPRGLCLPRLD